MGALTSPQLRQDFVERKLENNTQNLSPTAISASHPKMSEASNRRSSRSATVRNRQRQLRAKQQQFQIGVWFKRFDVNRSGALERDEVQQLLTHLHPEHPPDARALDLLIEKATEIKTYSMLLKGDKNGAVYPEKILKVVSVYAAYVIASAAFDRLDSGTGVLQLKDLPNLMAEARATANDDHSDVNKSEISFLIGRCSTRDGDIVSIPDDESIAASIEGGTLKRDELLQTLARLQDGQLQTSRQQRDDGDDDDDDDDDDVGLLDDVAEEGAPAAAGGGGGAGASSSRDEDARFNPVAEAARAALAASGPQEAQEHLAATRVQSEVRGRLARRLQAARHAAAVRLQAAVRGRGVRQRGGAPPLPPRDEMELAPGPPLQRRGSRSEGAETTVCAIL